MGIDLSTLATNANKLDEYIDKNEKQEWKRKEKDEQLYYIIERKVKKEEHKRERPRSRDGTLKECKRLFEEGASPEVLTKLEESLREQEKYYRYYTQCFLPVLGEVIERSKKISNETKEQAISEITKSYFDKNRKDSKSESGYGSDFEDEVNGTPDNDIQLLKAIKNGNNRKFRKYLKDCTNVNGIKDEKGNNILHLIASLKKKQKCKFLGTLIKTTIIAQLVDSENQEGKIPFQVGLIDKITKEKHESNTVRSSDNTLKFLTKLLEYGAKLILPTEDLEKLSKKQNEYYCKFLEKLAERKPETKTKVKEVIAHAINTSNSNGDYSLHLAIENKDEKLFKELLQKGADISLKDANGNNALHLIVTELKKKRKLEFLNIVLNISEEEEKKQLKAQFTKAINAENIAKQTPLYQLLQYIGKKSESQSLRDKEFKETARYKILELFLQNGADITIQDDNGKNALHYIASFEGKQRATCLELISDKDGFSNAVNTTNKEGLIPLHQLFQRIKEKNEDRSCTDRKFEKTNRYKALELFLQNGADITVQDKEGNNTLHHIALLKGEQKIACLNLILDLVEKGVLSKEKLGEAAKVANGQGNTPLELALKKKAVKERAEYLSPLQKTTVFSPIIDNTTKFCAKLLEVGADSCSLKLKDQKFHTEKYYCTLLNLENYSKTPQEGKGKAKKLRKGLEKKYNVRTFSKKCQRILHKTGNGFKALWECIDPGRRASILLAITVATTIITMVTLSCFQGQIAIGAALPIIAITGVVCLIVTLGLSGIRKSVKELTTNEQGMPNPTVEQNKVFKNETQQNLENEHKNSEKQELQQRPLDLSSEIPDTKLSIVSLIRCLGNLAKL